jgi:hypothetical protein
LSNNAGVDVGYIGIEEVVIAVNAVDTGGRLGTFVVARRCGR